MDDVKIDGNSYYTIHATFKEIEGLPINQDEFILYINPKTFLVDFYAQDYSLFLGKAVFKKAINPRTVNGLRFADYHAYYVKSREIQDKTLEVHYKLYNENKLERLNDIILQNLEVKLH